MGEIDSLELWRYVVSFTKRGFPYTPFVTAGYAGRPRIEPHIEYEGAKFAPDMVISSPEKWAIIDLTLNSDKRPESVAKYSTLPKGVLADLGMRIPKRDIRSVVVFGSDRSVTEDKCKEFKSAGIVIGPEGEGNKFYDNKDHLKDDKLRAEFNGIPDSLPPAPTIFLAVPETSGKRLRKAIAAILPYYVESGEKRTFHAHEMVSDLLNADGNNNEKIFSSHSRQKMEGNIRNQLINAMQHLNEKLKKRFISYNQRTEEFTLYPEKIPKGRLLDAIKAWSEMLLIDDFS